MKYIITENRLNKVIFNYLDTMLSGLEQKKGKNYDVVFGFPNEKYGILGWKNSGTLVIYYKIADEISYYFGMESSDIEKIIGEWVEDRCNLKVIKAFKTSRSKQDIIEDRYNLKVI
jgi:hypothetical protein